MPEEVNDLVKLRVVHAARHKYQLFRCSSTTVTGSHTPDALERLADSYVVGSVKRPAVAFQETKLLRLRGRQIPTVAEQFRDLLWSVKSC